MYETRTEALGEEVGDIREGEKKREGRGEKKNQCMLIINMDYICVEKCSFKKKKKTFTGANH